MLEILTSGTETKVGIKREVLTKRIRHKIKTYMQCTFSKCILLKCQNSTNILTEKNLYIVIQKRYK